MGYFVNWGIYARNFKPQEIPAQSLTHLLYAFAKVSADGQVSLTDPWADEQVRITFRSFRATLMQSEQIHYDGDSWNDQGTNLYGCFKSVSSIFIE